MAFSPTNESFSYQARPPRRKTWAAAAGAPFPPWNWEERRVSFPAICELAKNGAPFYCRGFKICARCQGAGLRLLLPTPAFHSESNEGLLKYAKHLVQLNRRTI
jgi:hypothetical protein